MSQNPLLNLRLRRELLATFSENFAKTRVVLPLQHRSGRYRIAVAESRRDNRPFREALAELVSDPIDFEFHAAADVSEAVAWHYGAMHHTIDNCSRDWFQFLCPRSWERLQVTDNPTVRFCRGCRKKVYLCHTDDELAEHVKQSHCVAVQPEGCLGYLGYIEEDGFLLR